MRSSAWPQESTCWVLHKACPSLAPKMCEGRWLPSPCHIGASCCYIPSAKTRPTEEPGRSTATALFTLHKAGYESWCQRKGWWFS